ncbi:unnamed protein product [Gordionus sp. m RMFG-2023]
MISTSNILESNPDIQITNSFIDQFLGLPKSRLISGIPRGVRQVVSSNYAQCIDRLLKNFSSKDVWSAFLLFGHKSFQIPAANGNSFTRNIKLASSNANYEPHNIITHTCNKKQYDLNFKVKLIDNKINNSDINGVHTLSLALRSAGSYLNGAFWLIFR